MWGRGRRWGPGGGPGWGGCGPPWGWRSWGSGGYVAGYEPGRVTRELVTDQLEGMRQQLAVLENLLDEELAEGEES